MENTINISGMLTELNYLNKRYNKGIIQVKRTSGTADFLPVLFERGTDLHIGDYLHVTGELKSFDDKYSTTNKLKSFIRAKTTDLSVFCNECDNYIVLEGKIVKSPVFRITATGRRIQRLMIANNCPDANYIPCLVWGDDAMQNRNVGDTVRITGRLQSRTYNKNGKDITVYEVSAESVTHVAVSTNCQHNCTQTPVFPTV